MKERRTLEELELDLLEIQACKSLQQEGFSFDGVTIIGSDSNFAIDPYYEAAEKNLLAAIQKIEEKQMNMNGKKVKKLLNKRNLY